MGRTSNPWQTPRVVFNPDTALGMLRGINLLAHTIRPTLGPLPRFVIDRNFGIDLPESLDSGAVIARRIIQLPDRQADVGAMYLRNLLWRLHETVGDGTATAAVLFQAIFQEGVRFVQASESPMQLRRHLEQGAELIDQFLVAQTSRVSGRDAYARLAETISGDSELSLKLGELFEIIGPYGRLEIRGGHRDRLEHRYIEGHYWNSALLSPSFITNPNEGRAYLANPAIFLSDLEISEPAQLIPVMEAALANGASALLLVVKSITPAATAVLLAPQNRERLLTVAVRTPGNDVPTIYENLTDLSLLVGGRVLFTDAGDTTASVTPETLGRARRAWADNEFLGVVGGGGNAAARREHVAKLREQLAQAQKIQDHQRLLERIGVLQGGAATLWAGAISATAIDVRKALASRTAEALRGALREGVVPGGGVALLDCATILRSRAAEESDNNARAAYSMLAKACEAPFRALVENAGFEPSEVLADVREHGPGYGLDVLRREVVSMRQAGILDSAGVLRTAVNSTIRSAALALTIDVIVHRANPLDSSTNP